jgi:N-acetyl-anhydromuramoyl-L-alanine amidase
MDKASDNPSSMFCVAEGRLAGAEFHCSPHQDERPSGAVPNLIIIHGISLPPGEFGGPWIDHLFMDRLDRSAHPYFEEITSLKVSAHVLIGRDGRVTQYVPFHRRAWHAGRSCHDGREACNDFSIGIELVGDDHVAYDEAQYRALCDVIAALFLTYPSLTEDRIVGHEHVSPGRKTDPGPAFDWQLFGERLGHLLAAQAERGQSVDVAQGNALGTETDR